MLDKAVVEGILGDFKIVKEFPRTGQKQVFVVKDKIGENKILKIVSYNDPRVLREIEIIKSNDIPYVPKISGEKVIDINGVGFLFYFEEFLPSGSLSELLKIRKLELREGVKLLECLLDICCYLEKINVVHRDIKPDNIMLNGEEFALIDFGIARQLDCTSLTATMAAVGPHTPGYGAPELFKYQRAEIDIRADLFSIGVVLFQALTGEHPFITGNEQHLDEIWYRTRTVIPKDFLIEGDTEKQLISFIQTLMQKIVSRRPSTAQKAKEWYNALKSTLNFGG